MIKPFIRHDSKVLLTTPIFRLRQDRASHPVTGHTGDYFVLENPDWVNMVAITDDDRLVMVRQYRHGSGAVELELPAGMIEPGESPTVAAARELAEETGYVADSWQLIGQVRPNCAFQNNTCFTTLARGCRLAGETHFDPGEDLELVLASKNDLRQMVRDGTLRNGMVIAAVFWWLDSDGRLSWE
jgi:8-oxo-dGTP pyrophosphatase MutT (NUDIX family)